MKLKLLLGILMGGLIMLALPAGASAATTALSIYSWDQGLSATKNTFNYTVHAWGRRATSGAWGTGPVNYQSGATTVNRASSTGSLTVTMNGTYCNGTCTYGGGSGYKGLVQFWNDPNNYVAFGLIHDPGVSPNGMTIMIEGAGGGMPVGGYWPGGSVTGSSHLFRFQWTASGITVTVDNNTTLGPYPVAASNPSISFLAAARNTGDISDTTFTGINFSSGSVVEDSIVIPPTTPYLTYSATLTESGTGTGHAAYINAHDASSNAVSVGVQTDTGSPESQGQPWYIWELVQDGKFTFYYVSPASHGSEPVTLKWWKDEQTAVFYAGASPKANIEVNLVPRLFFNAEGNARINGDSVNDTITNVQVTVGNACPTYCGLNGAWNVTDFNFYGLTASNTNGQPQNGANFAVSGTVAGLPPGGNWDTHLVAGIAMIAQFWNGL